MTIVINIPDIIYQTITLLHDGILPSDGRCIGKAIKEGQILPKGHGRLIEADKIEIPLCEDRTYEKWVQVAIDAAPTIIEADKEQQDD